MSSPQGDTQPVPDSIRAFATYMERHHSLPMPAGPLVPRSPLQINNPWYPALTPKHRTYFAVRALEATFGTDTQMNVAPSFLLACEEWEAVKGLGARWEQSAVLDIYKAFCVVADDDPDRLVHVLHNFGNRLKDLRRPKRQRAAEHSMNSPGDALDTGWNESAQASVDLVLKHPDGGWKLLGLLFLNLLQGHLGLPSAKIHSPEMAERLYAPVRQLLAAWGADATAASRAVSDDSLAASALGLSIALRTLAPYTCPVGKGSITLRLIATLPACFNPGAVGRGSIEESIQQAMRLLCEREQTIESGLAKKQVNAVAAIAQEVAAALTDSPTLGATLGSEGVAALGLHHSERLHQRGDRRGKSQATLDFLARGKRVTSLLDWLHRAGLADPACAAHLEPLQPLHPLLANQASHIFSRTRTPQKAA